MAEETVMTSPAKPPRKTGAASKQKSANGSASGSTKAKTVVDRAKETTSRLASEAATAARNAANEGKDRASEALSGVSKAVEGAASMVEEKIGPAYGNYARKAADQVSGLAQSLQSKDIDDLIADTRTFIRKQPIVAIGAAAAIGFVLTRLVKLGTGGASDDDHTA